ncbi:MAG: PAS domain-containing protein, partial [Desulfatiglandales bacterium]
MAAKPTYEELEEIVKELKKEASKHRRAQEALRETEEHYRTLVQNIPVAVYRNTPGPEGRFLMANPTFLKMFGLDSEEEFKKTIVTDLYMN